MKEKKKLRGDLRRVEAFAKQSLGEMNATERSCRDLMYGSRGRKQNVS